MSFELVCDRCKTKITKSSQIEVVHEVTGFLTYDLYTDWEGKTYIDWDEMRVAYDLLRETVVCKACGEELEGFEVNDDDLVEYVGGKE